MRGTAATSCRSTITIRACPRRFSTILTRAREWFWSSSIATAPSIPGTASRCNTLIRPRADTRCPPLAHLSNYCHPVFAAGPIDLRRQPSIRSSKAAAEAKSATQRLIGRNGISLLFRPGIRFHMKLMKRPSFSVFPIGPSRKLWDCGGNKRPERSRNRNIPFLAGEGNAHITAFTRIYKEKRVNVTGLRDFIVCFHWRLRVAFVIHCCPYSDGHFCIGSNAKTRRGRFHPRHSPIRKHADSRSHGHCNTRCHRRETRHFNRSSWSVSDQTAWCWGLHC